MTGRLVTVVAAGLFVVEACGPHAAGLPKGPAPEYERPPLAAWGTGGTDGGAPRKAQEIQHVPGPEAGTLPR